MTVRRSHRSAVCLALLATPIAAAVELDRAAAPLGWPADPEQGTVSRLQLALSQDMRRPLRKPEWLRDYPASGVDFKHHPPDGDQLNLVLQEDRRDGTDLLTLRYPLLNVARIRGYVGAGLGQTLYVEANETGPTVIFARGNRHRMIGAAAEAGFEARLSDQVRLSADLRWVELDARADLLRTDDGVVEADAVAVGVSLGWRFR